MLSGAAAEPLRRVAAIRALPREVAFGNLPVEVPGVVSYHESFSIGKAPPFIVHDGEAGIYVTWDPHTPGPSPPLQIGEAITVTGVTLPGGYAPMIRATGVLRTGRAPLPAARPVALPELMTGQYDCQQVSLSGVVQRFHLSSLGVFRFEMANRDGTFTVFIRNKEGLDSSTIVDSTLRVSGACFTFFNSRGECNGVNLRLIDRSQVEIEEAGHPDPFSAPPVSELALQPFLTTGPVLRRQRLTGTVTLARAGDYFYVQSAQRAYRVQSYQTDRLQPGDVVEASGFAQRTEGYAMLGQAVFRVTGRTTPPPARSVTAAQLLTYAATGNDLRVEDYDGSLVALKGTYLKTDRDEQGEFRLYFDCEGRVTLATLGPDLTPDVLSHLQPGSQVELTGICQQQISLSWPNIQQPRATAFRLLMRDAGDIRLLSQASWWTTRRLSWALGITGAILAAFAVWNVTLRRIVAAQTGVIREKIARASRLEERQRIGRELHDTLQQELTGIGMLIGTTKRHLGEPAKAIQSLDMAERMVHRCSEESRSSILDLQSVTLETRGLTAAIEELVRPLAEIQGAVFQQNVTGTPRPLPTRTESALLRLAHEAAANAGRHSRARRVDLTLDFEADHLKMTVKDDGCGFDPTLKRSVNDRHFGLLGMDERVLKLRGTLEIESSPGDGRGTTVRITLPYP